ncbi:MAG: hypothetical protein IPQ25_11340 [Chitinophagaceae bacterium]|nr:hypothetical protein [Chitinophagaceae bacterium]
MKTRKSLMPITPSSYRLYLKKRRTLSPAKKETHKETTENGTQKHFKDGQFFIKIGSWRYTSQKIWLGSRIRTRRSDFIQAKRKTKRGFLVNSKSHTDL